MDLFNGEELVGREEKCFITTSDDKTIAIQIRLENPVMMKQGEMLMLFLSLEDLENLSDRVMAVLGLRASEREDRED